MTDIDEVRERLWHDAALTDDECPRVRREDLDDLLADHARLKAEIDRLKREAGYTAADIATAAADGFRDGVASVDLEQFREAVHAEFELACESRMFEVISHDEHEEAKGKRDRLLALIDSSKSNDAGAGEIRAAVVDAVASGIETGKISRVLADRFGVDGSKAGEVQP